MLLRAFFVLKLASFTLQAYSEMFLFVENVLIIVCDGESKRNRNISVHACKVCG